MQISRDVEFVNEKQDRENYLFEDCHSKSGIEIWILALMISGRSSRKWV